MLVDDKVAVIYGGGGAIGGAVARELAREGAHVFLAGRTRAKLERVAADIARAGGRAEVAVLDALDEAAVNAHADAVVERVGRIDIVLNAIGIDHVQGKPFMELSLAEYETPIAPHARASFITAKAAARHMVARRSGVIMSLSTPGSRMAGQGFLGYGVACGAIETFSRILAGELGASGVRVVCLRPDVIPESVPTSYGAKVFGEVAARNGTTVEAMFETARARTLLGRFPTLAEVASFAAFVASDRAGAMTGAIVNLTCGSVVD